MMARTGNDCDFWDERVPIHQQSHDDYIDFQVQKHVDQDDHFSTSSPPLWTKISKNSSPTHEVKSPLLRHDHRYSSCLSPTSRLRAILDGKRELMEMIKDMPESSFELSLKDIVEDHAEVKEVVLVEEKKHKIGARIIPQNNNEYTSSKICRSGSMDSGVFLLKMFFPAYLISSKKRSDARKAQSSRKWWKNNIMFLFVREYKNRSRNIGTSNTETSSGENRFVDDACMPCEWSLCINRKCKSRGQRGCLF